jgi:hypothetical protein
MISEQELAAYERAYQEATPGDWYVVRPPWGEGDYVVAGDADPQIGRFVADMDTAWVNPEADDYALPNAEFVETARNAWPRLLATVRTLQAENAALRRQVTGLQDDQAVLRAWCQEQQAAARTHRDAVAQTTQDVQGVRVRAYWLGHVDRLNLLWDRIKPLDTGPDPAPNAGT